VQNCIISPRRQRLVSAFGEEGVSPITVPHALFAAPAYFAGDPCGSGIQPNRLRLVLWSRAAATDISVANWQWHLAPGGRAARMPCHATMPARPTFSADHTPCGRSGLRRRFPHRLRHRRPLPTYKWATSFSPRTHHSHAP
jgi:hypothetical protein